MEVHRAMIGVAALCAATAGCDGSGDGAGGGGSTGVFAAGTGSDSASNGFNPSSVAGTNVGGGATARRT